MAQQNQIVRLLELGVSQVNMNSRDQGLAIAALAQESARARVAAAAPTALTDSSTGVGGTSLAAVVTPTKGSHDGVTSLAPKTAFDTAIGLVEDANEELLAKANEFIVLVAGSTAATVTPLSTAAVANNIIAAMAKALAGGITNAVPADDGIAQVVAARNAQASIAAALNYGRVALGLEPMTDGSGGHFDRSQTRYPTTDAAATGAAIVADGTDNSLTDASVDAALDALANNVATMAASLNEMRGTLAIGPFVVATNNPRARFVTADTTV